MAQRRVNTTKLEIIQTATRMFLEQGYSATSVKMIANSLDISTGHLTFYFPTKVHLLTELVDMLCKFQWEKFRQYVDDGENLLMAVCLELTAMAAICEQNEIVKDFYLSAYTHPMTLEIIRKNDTQRAKIVFGEYCKNWERQHFAEAETLVSGIEYATLMTTEDSAPIDMRIAGALNNIMFIFQVPGKLREKKIEQVLAMEYAAVGRQMLEEFKAFIEETNEQAFENLMNRKQSK